MRGKGRMTLKSEYSSREKDVWDLVPLSVTLAQWILVYATDGTKKPL